MGSITVNDDAIWIKNIDGSPELRERIRGLRAGETLDLEVDGIVGRWERMRDGRDGRPTLGIKPIAEMRSVWARIPRGKTVRLREVVTADAYLASLGKAFDEWSSPADEAAYRDL